MKKLISFALCLVLSIFALAGCSNNGEAFKEKMYTPDTRISEINLDVRDREIEVVFSEDEQVHIQYSESSKEYYKITVSDEHVLTMESANNKNWTDYIGGKAPIEDRKIVLQIPDALLENLQLSTTNGGILLSALTVNGNVALATNGGDISLERLNAGKSLSITAKNGNVEGTIMGSYDDYAIQTKMKKGKSNLPTSKADGAKTLNVSSNNGNVSIEFVKE